MPRGRPTIVRVITPMGRRTDEYEGMIAETVAIRGFGDDYINAYIARPTGAGPYPAMVLFHHRPVLV